MLGSVLRAARETAGLTQEALADAAGIDRTYVSLLERDKKSPTVSVLVRICDALGVPASAVLAEMERKKNRPN
jgi:transcriptional regulator with XRE-family HTH domain